MIYYNQLSGKKFAPGTGFSPGGDRCEYGQEEKWWFRAKKGKAQRKIGIKRNLLHPDAGRGGHVPEGVRSGRALPHPDFVLAFAVCGAN